jgi:hypothetical protein
MQSNIHNRPDPKSQRRDTAVVLESALGRYVPLARVAATLPRLRHGAPVHLSTVHRWVQRGIGGVRLRVVSIGGTKCTTRRWLMEFFEQLGAHRRGTQVVTTGDERAGSGMASGRPVRARRVIEIEAAARAARTFVRDAPRH